MAQRAEGVDLDGGHVVPSKSVVGAGEKAGAVGTGEHVAALSGYVLKGVVASGREVVEAAGVESK